MDTATIGEAGPAGPVFLMDEEEEGNIVIGILWFFVIALMFFSQHHVCDCYFVPAINVFVGKMRKSENTWLQRWGEEAVAGATICALGCNGPELFTNLISLFTHSDAGIGVVVGSEIFNLLVIIGAATIAAPILPLELERVPFGRDVAFYALSIVLLKQFLGDEKIEAWEAWTLLGAAVVYVFAVYFTTDIVMAIPCLRPAEIEEGLPTDMGSQKTTGVMHGIEVEVEEVLHGRMADAHREESDTYEMNPTAAGIYSKPAGEFKKMSSSAKLKRRMSSDGAGPARKSMGITFKGKEDPLLGANMLAYKDLKEVSVLAEGVIQLEFSHNAFHHITLKMTVATSDQRDELLKMIEQYSLGKPWIHKYDPTVFGAIGHLKHTLADKDAGVLTKILALPEFLVDFCLKATLACVDVKDITKEGRWALCFLGAMVWLGIFSFSMLMVAGQIHKNIPALSEAFLGITVCAVGTSFPNAVASVIMASQNKPAAAIANALGSNVQNVFLAMALPWVIYLGQTNWEPIPQEVAGINEGVAWMFGTLILVVFFVLMPGVCTLDKCYGYILVVFYFIYLGITCCETFGVIKPLIK
eukprot:gnl/TRDRNA2_/TRDRNA2_39140_c0_seq1.p1 gnl/TRDRNA2_/TRDRNA2_39140_c0~~gnl/TRDRNA2_/TRDRNA2_39140_c0_seq1.p1  ORF type:complete len:584 (-),score=123.61 gnl/TRDRNA2_/TRDRNA2_39140_c0_seq1:122-1873(-)